MIVMTKSFLKIALFVLTRLPLPIEQPDCKPVSQETAERIDQPEELILNVQWSVNQGMRDIPQRDHQPEQKAI